MRSDGLEPILKRAWAEIDLDAVEYNFNAVKKQIEGKKKICCVVKANAYGHGAIMLSKIYEKCGADYLAVSNIIEAIQLRNNNISLPILILGYTDPQCAEILEKHNITQCVYSKEYALELAKVALKYGIIVKVHIKLDTGMGRIGFVCKNGSPSPVKDIIEIAGLKNLAIEGIFTHFASADEGKNGSLYTRNQFARFTEVVENLEKNGVKIRIKHCANSAVILDYPDMQLDMVRAGIVLYGMNPSSDIENKLELKPVMKLCSVVDNIKLVKKGEYVSYGREYEATKNRMIATIPIGYADGLWRSNASNGFRVKINNKYANIVGRICMDQCMIDVTDMGNVTVGTKVMIFGNDCATVESIATTNKTISYEILCAVGERVPRVYLKNDRIISVSNSLFDK